MAEHDDKGSIATSGALQPDKSFTRKVLDLLASVPFLLWMLGILTVAMALATIIPQRAPTEMYNHALGQLLGPLVAKSALHDVYGAWWFIGGFAALAAGLVVCTLRRLKRLLRVPDPASVVTEARVRGSACWGEWKIAQEADAVAAELKIGLPKRGYSALLSAPPPGNQRGLVARRGAAASWSSVAIHCGMVIVLLGAAYGRLPANSYRRFLPLTPGQAQEVTVGTDRFSVRLLSAGSEEDRKGRPTRFWAKAEILEDGKVVKSAMIEPNRTLRHRGVNVVLSSLLGGESAVEVKQGTEISMVPVVIGPDGAVAMMDTVRHLKNPPWVVFIHDYRANGESGQADPAAQVFIDRSGHLSHQWDRVGWVGKDGVTLEGVEFKLVAGSQGAQLLLDRDLGVPIVWLGFAIVSIGAFMLVALNQRTIRAVVVPAGDGSRVLLGGNDARAYADGERVLSGMGAMPAVIKRRDTESGKMRAAT